MVAMRRKLPFTQLQSLGNSLVKLVKDKDCQTRTDEVRAEDTPLWRLDLKALV